MVFYVHCVCDVGHGAAFGERKTPSPPHSIQHRINERRSTRAQQTADEIIRRCRGARIPGVQIHKQRTYVACGSVPRECERRDSVE